MSIDRADGQDDGSRHQTSGEQLVDGPARSMWSIGMLRDPETDEVPGSILLMSKNTNRNEPLGIHNSAARNSVSSFRSSHSASSLSQAMFGRRAASGPEKKRTKDGKIILEPQPDDSGNDPLNWTTVRRDAALISLGFYCLVGGGMTTVLAPGFTNVAATFDVSIPDVAYTTGLYMMGLGLGSVIASPTAIAFGKRPVYLVASILFVITSVWCALSPAYASLVVARVFQGMAVSPVECLPSATIAEIFFLHERAYRLGIYTLLLLGGKNLVPLASAGIIQGLGWRWVFWVVAMIVGFCFCLLFLFVPETFWDRTPRGSRPHRRPSFAGLRKVTSNGRAENHSDRADQAHILDGALSSERVTQDKNRQLLEKRQKKRAHFAPEADEVDGTTDGGDPEKRAGPPIDHSTVDSQDDPSTGIRSEGLRPLEEPASPTAQDYFSHPLSTLPTTDGGVSPASPPLQETPSVEQVIHPYTRHFSSRPPKTFTQSLQPYSGRLNNDNWFRVAFRPFILFAYPAILWSAAVYALSVGWLIIISESVSTIYRSKDTYNFTAIATGLVYISPFVGGILGTAVAGKASDYLVRYIARKNGGIYEPEFRLFMAIPVAFTTTIGLMGYGWSAQERDNFWVPTIFFGIISFGCTLGSTTAITFAVDSYRQYAGEALVTLNFSKNIFDGLVFSLFFNRWLEDDGSKLVFICLGGIQLFFLLWTIPMYIFGKRLRMWTVRKNMMEKF